MLALMAICGIYVSMLYLILYRHGIALAGFGTTSAIGVVLFFTCYQNLLAPKPPPVEEENGAP